MSDTSPKDFPHRGLITISIMLATIMQVLDTTIANVALPSMTGDLGASQDTINWVLTSYIVAAAIMTPVTGWLSDRIGRKELFVVSIVGFTVASILCGVAWSLESMVAFRLLQGVFGAAIVPLSISATPFLARIAEVSLREVEHGLIEAAQAIGCRRWHIIRHVLLPEALPGLVGGFTITVVSMIGASAMAGAVGAGGLGDMAIRYGYQRFLPEVMLAVVIVLIVLVQIVQSTGDWIARRVNKRNLKS